MLQNRTKARIGRVQSTNITTRKKNRAPPKFAEIRELATSEITPSEVRRMVGLFQSNIYHCFFVFADNCELLKEYDLLNDCEIFTEAVGVMMWLAFSLSTRRLHMTLKRKLNTDGREVKAPF